VRYFGYDELSRLTSETWVVDDEVAAEKVYVYDAASNRVRLDESGELVSLSREATARCSPRREPWGGGAPHPVSPVGTTHRTAVPPFQGSGACFGPNPGFAPWAITCRPYRANDGDLRRWEKTDAGGTKLYRWDAGVSGRPGLAVVQEADSDGDTTADFTHDQGATIMPGVGTILSVREGANSRFLHTDVQGTTRTVTSAAEAVIAAYDLDAFGVQRSHTGAYSTPYLFTGKERDPGPSLDYFIARQYKAGRGVFLSKDPVGPQKGWYLYVGARPLEARDASGRSCWPEKYEPVFWDQVDCWIKGPYRVRWRLVQGCEFWYGYQLNLGYQARAQDDARDCSLFQYFWDCAMYGTADAAHAAGALSEDAWVEKLYGTPGGGGDYEWPQRPTVFEDSRRFGRWDDYPACPYQGGGLDPKPQWYAIGWRPPRNKYLLRDDCTRFLACICGYQSAGERAAVARCWEFGYHVHLGWDSVTDCVGKCFIKCYLYPLTEVSAPAFVSEACSEWNPHPDIHRCPTYPCIRPDEPGS